MKFHIQVNCYKPSGKYYSGKQHVLGEFDKYPASEIWDKMTELKSDLDSACAVVKDTIEINNFTVLYLILDDTSDPICMSGILRQSKAPK